MCKRYYKAIFNITYHLENREYPNLTRKVGTIYKTTKCISCKVSVHVNITSFMRD